MYDVITVGSGTIDVFMDTGSRLFQRVKGGNVHVPFGSKILVDAMNTSTGGGGTNTAVSLSRLGLKVAWLGKIGKGTNSERLLKEMEKEKVDTSLVRRDMKSRTGYSVILDAKGYDRTILVFKGSNDDLGWNEINKSKINAKWMYCSSMIGKSFKTLEKLVVFARKKGIKVAFNPSSYQAKKGAGFLKNVIKNTNLLVMNDEEAGYLTKEKSIEKSLKKLASMGPEFVVITLGPKKKVYVYNQKKIYKMAVKAKKAVEATGAGDSFASAFLAGIIRKNDINFALKLGFANAESVVTHYGAKNKLLTWNQAMKKIK